MAYMLFFIWIKFVLLLHYEHLCETQFQWRKNWRFIELVVLCPFQKYKDYRYADLLFSFPLNNI